MPNHLKKRWRAFEMQAQPENGLWGNTFRPFELSADEPMQN